MLDLLAKLVREATGANPPWYITALVAAVVGAVVAYFAGYLAEKAKLRAIEENVEKLIAQAELTTRATEDIKTSIAGGLWLHQARWMAKKEIYAGYLKALGEFRLQGRDPGTNEERRRSSGERISKLHRDLLSHFSLGRVFTTGPTYEIIAMLIQELSIYDPERDDPEDLTYRRINDRAQTAFFSVANAACQDLMDFSPPPQGV